MMSSVITLRLNRRRAFSNDSPSCSRISATLITPKTSTISDILELTPFVPRSAYPLSERIEPPHRSRSLLLRSQPKAEPSFHNLLDAAQLSHRSLRIAGRTNKWE